MKPILLFTLLLLISAANANHLENAKQVLNEWDSPDLEIISPENQSSKQVGKNNETREGESSKRKTIQDSEEKELKDFIERFYDNLDESYSYDDEYEGKMDYNKRNIGRANWTANGRKKKEDNRTEKPKTERQLGNVSKTTALLNKQNRTLNLLEDELLKLIMAPESNKGKKGFGQTWKEKGFGHTWKEIVEKQSANRNESLGQGKLNNTALLKKQKQDLERMEKSLSNIIKKVEEKVEKDVGHDIAQPKKVESNNVEEKLTGAYSDAKKNVNQVVDRARLREAEVKDAELEERIKGWKTDVDGDAKDKVVGSTPKGQQSVAPLVDDIHRSLNSMKKEIGKGFADSRQWLAVVRKKRMALMADAKIDEN